MYIIGDIGGTNTRIAAANSFAKIGRVERVKTPRFFAGAKKELTLVIDKLAGGKKPDAILLGVPGILNRKKEALFFAPNLRGWQKKNIVSFFEGKYQCPVFLENDSALGGLGEAVYGAGKKENIVGYLAIGTGIGGTRIVNKRIDFSSKGFEPGHHIMRPNGRAWPCGQRGCFEAYASGLAFAKDFGINPAKVLPSKKILERYAKVLGRGIVNVIVFWSPDMVIIGGGMANLGQNFLLPLKKYVQKNLKIFLQPKIVLGTLGDRAGLYGGLYLLKQKLENF